MDRYTDGLVRPNGACRLGSKGTGDHLGNQNTRCPRRSLPTGSKGTGYTRDSERPLPMTGLAYWVQREQVTTPGLRIQQIGCSVVIEFTFCDYFTFCSYYYGDTRDQMEHTGKNIIPDIFILFLLLW